MSRIAQIRATNHPLKDLLRSYYKSCPLDISKVPDVKFRHFRLRLLEGTFHKVKQKIHSSEDLREYLTKYVPMDVYYSTATWLNPHLIASRLDKDLLKNIYLSCDLSFDIDVSNKIRTLAEAQTQAATVLDFLESKGFKNRYIAFSGSKGFHIVCDDPWASEVRDLEPLKRELGAIAKRKELVEEASRRKIHFDEKVTVDTRRIIRLPGTINSKTGLACITLSKKNLLSDIETILKSATREGFSAPRIPPGEMTAPSANKISGLMGRLGVRPRPKENINYSLFYTNNIPGTQLKIPILEFYGWMKLNDLIHKIDVAQCRYDLGPIYVFRDDEKYWAVSLKALSRRRVEKILSFTGSININQSKKYGCIYTRIGKSLDIDGEIIQGEPEFLKQIKSDFTGQVSKTHFEFFKSLGIPIEKIKGVFCGGGLDQLELVHAIIE